MRFLATISALFKKDFFTAVNILIFGLVPLFAYLFFDWGFYHVMFLFWFEGIILSFMIGLTYVFVTRREPLALFGVLLLFFWQMLLLLIGLDFFYLNTIAPFYESEAAGFLDLVSFGKMFDVLPGLLEAVLYLFVASLVVIFRRIAMIHIEKKFNLENYSYVLFSSSLVYVYLLLLIVSLLVGANVQFGLNFNVYILAVVILFKLCADFFMASMEYDLYEGDFEVQPFGFKKKPRLVVRKKDVKRGWIYACFWFVAPFVFTVLITAFTGTMVDEYHNDRFIFYLLIVEFFLFLPLLVLLLFVFFNSGRRALVLTSNDGFYYYGWAGRKSFFISEIEKVVVNRGKKDSLNEYIDLVVHVRDSLKPRKLDVRIHGAKKVSSFLKELGKANKKIRLVGMQKLKASK